MCPERVYRSQVSKMPNMFFLMLGNGTVCGCVIHPAPAMALPFLCVKAQPKQSPSDLAELKEKVCISCGSVLGLFMLTDLSWLLPHVSLLCLPPVCGSVCTIHPSIQSVIF